MKKAHARPSKRYVCDGCKRRIRWASQVHRVGRHGQLIWCDECYGERIGVSQEGPPRETRAGFGPSESRRTESAWPRDP